ncbi:MAG: protein translocase subunit SecF [Vicinamibacterales bacterium]
MHIFKNPNYDFVRWKWQAIALSWVVILAGIYVIETRGMPKGVEFSGGTIVVVKFPQTPNVEQVRASLDRTISGGGANAIVQRYGDPGANQVMIRVHSAGSESGQSISTTADQVAAGLRQAGLGDVSKTCSPTSPPPCTASTEIVGPTVGSELQTRGLLATVFALAGILVYVAFRFQFSFAVGAVVATVHDLLVTLAFLAFFRYDMSLNVIAAILTITGYSMNDTIVIYDRIRENMRSMRRDDLTRIVNVSVNQMLDRTFITGGLTMLSVIALYLFGGEVLKGFAFTMIIGIITGTYSSVFIAAAIVIIWQGKRRVAATAPAAPVKSAKNAPSKKQGSKARAS